MCIAGCNFAGFEQNAKRCELKVYLECIEVVSMIQRGKCMLSSPGLTLYLEIFENYTKI